MSKQIRIDDNAYDDLVWMARQAGEKPTNFNSMTVKLFRQLFERLQKGGRLIVEVPNSEKVELFMPFRIKKRQ